MKVREVVTVALLFFAGYSVIKDLFFTDKQCYYEEILENGNVLGTWSSANCQIKAMSSDIASEHNSYSLYGIAEASYNYIDLPHYRGYLI